MDWKYDNYREDEDEPEVEPSFEFIGSFLPFPVRAFDATEGISPKLAFHLWEYWHFFYLTGNNSEMPVGDPVPFSILLKFLLDAFIQTKLACPTIRLNGEFRFD